MLYERRCERRDVRKSLWGERFCCSFKLWGIRWLYYLPYLTSIGKHHRKHHIFRCLSGCRYYLIKGLYPAIFEKPFKHIGLNIGTFVIVSFNNIFRFGTSKNIYLDGSCNWPPVVPVKKTFCLTTICLSQN